MKEGIPECFVYIMYHPVLKTVCGSVPGSSPGGFGAGSSSQSMFGGAPAPSMIGNNQPFQGKGGKQHLC